MNVTSNYEDEFLDDLQDFEYKKMLEKAENVVLGFVASTSATGAIPIPFADAPLLIAQQVAMMASINGVFKFDISKDALKSLATAALGVGGATMLGKTVATNLIKLIPFAGSIVGGAISAGTAGIITLALGKSYIQVCKAIKMGKLNQSDLSRNAGKEILKNAFKEQLKKTKSSDVDAAKNQHQAEVENTTAEKNGSRNEKKFSLTVLSAQMVKERTYQAEVRINYAPIHKGDLCASKYVRYGIISISVGGCEVDSAYDGSTVVCELLAEKAINPQGAVLTQISE